MSEEEGEEKCPLSSLDGEELENRAHKDDPLLFGKKGEKRGKKITSASPRAAKIFITLRRRKIEVRIQVQA